MSFHNHREAALAQAWQLYNGYHLIPEGGHREALLYIAWHWANALGYETIAVPENVTEFTLRRFCRNCIDDLSPQMEIAA